MSEFKKLNKQNLKNLENRVWITKKIRMEAAERRIDLNNQFNLVLNIATVLALLMSIMSLLPNRILSNNNISMLSIAISIGVMVTALLITGYNFTEDANQFRKSYLNLDKLENNIRDEINSDYDDIKKTIKLEKEYNRIQTETLNHNNMDFIYFKISQKNNERKTMNNNKEKRFEVGKWEKIEFIFSKHILQCVSIFLLFNIVVIMVITVKNG